MQGIQAVPYKVNTYCPPCVEFVYVHKWCTDSIILILWWFTYARYFTSSCAITVTACVNV